MKEFDSKTLFSLHDKIALVTGASKGIGREVALLLASYGAKVGLVARNEEELKAVAKEIEAIGSKALFVPFDLTKTEEIPSMVKRIHDEFGSIDILINNAGTNVPKPMNEITEEDWDKVMDINLKSVFFTTQAVGEYMKEQQSGKIINVSSQLAFVGHNNRSVYSSSKGGITQLTKSLAIEWAPYNINVNAIAPTFVETSMTKETFKDAKLKEEILSKIPLGRIAKPEDLYGAFIYLSSNAADMVTGHTIVVDGGWTTW